MIVILLLTGRHCHYRSGRGLHDIAGLAQIGWLLGRRRVVEHFLVRAAALAIQYIVVQGNIVH